jgi:hypothetical protein
MEGVSRAMREMMHKNWDMVTPEILFHDILNCAYNKIVKDVAYFVTKDELFSDMVEAYVIDVIDTEYDINFLLTIMCELEGVDDSPYNSIKLPKAAKYPGICDVEELKSKISSIYDRYLDIIGNELENSEFNLEDIDEYNAYIFSKYIHPFDFKK